MRAPYLNSIYLIFFISSFFIPFSFNFIPSLLINTASAEDQHPEDFVFKDPNIIDLKPFEGKIIRSIKIIVDDVFEQEKLNSFFKTANKLKINTRESVIRRELLFKEGDSLDIFLLKESERNLRSQRFLRNIKIIPQYPFNKYPNDSNPNNIKANDIVDVIVKVQDTWTFIPSLNISAGSGSDSKSVGLAESNIAGFGKRVEFIAAEDSKRQTFEGLYEDPRVLGSRYNFIGAEFLRNDGDRTVIRFGDPFRTLLDKEAWSTNIDRSDTVGRLWQNNAERYVFHQTAVDLNSSYTWMFGNPERNLRRYSLGYRYIENKFRDASSNDFDDIDVDPDTVSHDPNLLASNRRFSGPILGYEAFKPTFIKMDYIDRFDRVEDFDIGDNFSLETTLAPKFLDSNDDALLFSGTRSAGSKLDSSSFIRGEFGFSGRYADDFSNVLLRSESKYYNVLGSLQYKDLFLGKHTLAFGYSLDWGHELDKDREFLLGADTGLRGYRVRTFTGDKRFISNFEDRIHLAEDVLKLMSVGAAVFTDIGGTTNKALGDIFTNNLYGDVGVGLRIAFPRSSGGKILRVDFALPLRDGPDGSRGFEARIIFAGGPIFSSQLRSEVFGAQDANVEVGFDR